MSITVANVRKTRDGVYVGRQASRAQGGGVPGGLNESPLANPFKIGEHGNRAEVIAKYEVWLRDRLACEGHRIPGLVYTQQRAELVRLVDLYEERGVLTLLCWCAPLPCHADVIAEEIRRRAGRPKGTKV